MNCIEREVYQFVNTYKEPIEMAQGTDGIPIIFIFADYDILPGTTVSVFVTKPSGKGIQNVAATVDPNSDTVTVNMVAQMTAEVGEAQIQLQLNNGKNVFTFNYP